MSWSDDSIIGFDLPFVIPEVTAVCRKFGACSLQIQRLASPAGTCPHDRRGALERTRKDKFARPLGVPSASVTWQHTATDASGGNSQRSMGTAARYWLEV